MKQSGRQTLGKYELIEEIGRGGFATVFRARDTTLERDVALKVLDPLLFRDPVFVKRFHQEAITAANLDHPSIVPVFEIAEAEQRHYIAMKLVGGGSLAERIETEGSLPTSYIVRIVEQVAAALDYVHEQGVVHRDVKPSNILINEDGRAMLSDFGLVRAAEGSRLSTRGVSIGTPAYMAPEQAEGEEVDARTDIYALGIVLYEMVTGKLPFSTDSPAATLYQHVHKAPAPPSSVSSEVTPPVEQVILRALEKDPDRRYQTARDLVKDLSEAVAGRMPAGIPPVSLGEETRGTGESETKGTGVSRMLKFAGAGIVLSVSLLCGLGLLWQTGVLGSIFIDETPTPVFVASENAARATAQPTETAQPTATITETAESTETPRTTHTPSPTATESPTPTGIPTDTSTPTATPTNTPAPSATPTVERESGSAEADPSSGSGKMEDELAPAYEITTSDGSTEPGQGELVVRYLRGDLSPIDGGYFRVYTQKQDLAGNWVTDDRIDGGHTDTTGQVSFELAPGHYILKTDVGGYNWGDAFDVKGKANIVVEVGKVTTVRITLARLIVGFAYGDGTPIDSKYVRIYTEKQDLAGNWVTSGKVTGGHTDNTGTVAFDLAPGHYIIYSGFSGYNWGEAHDVEGVAHYPLPPGQETTLIQRLGKLVVGLVDADGNPIEGKAVTVYLQSKDVGGETMAGDDVKFRRTGNSGTASFDLTPGLYAVKVSDSYTYDVPIEAGRITRFDGSEFAVEEP